MLKAEGQAETLTRLCLQSAWIDGQVPDPECVIGHMCSWSTGKSHGRLCSFLTLKEGNTSTTFCTLLHLFQEKKKSLTHTRIRENIFKPLLFCFSAVFCISHMYLGSGFSCACRIFSSVKLVLIFCKIVSKGEYFLQKFTIKLIIWVGFFCYCSVYRHFPTGISFLCISV